MADQEFEFGAYYESGYEVSQSFPSRFAVINVHVDFPSRYNVTGLTIDFPSRFRTIHVTADFYSRYLVPAIVTPDFPSRFAVANVQVDTYSRYKTIHVAIDFPSRVRSLGVIDYTSRYVQAGMPVDYPSRYLNYREVEAHFPSRYNTLIVIEKHFYSRYRTDNIVEADFPSRYKTTLIFEKDYLSRYWALDADLGSIILNEPPYEPPVPAPAPTPGPDPLYRPMPSVGGEAMEVGIALVQRYLYIPELGINEYGASGGSATAGTTRIRLDNRPLVVSNSGSGAIAEIEANAGNTEDIRLVTPYGSTILTLAPGEKKGLDGNICQMLVESDDEGQTLTWGGTVVGYYHYLSNFTCSRGINSGWNWSATVPYEIEFGLDFHEETEFVFEFKRGNTNWSSIRLIAIQRSLSASDAGGMSTTFQGIDFATFRLSKQNIDKATYSKAKSSDILNDLATIASDDELDAENGNYTAPAIAIEDPPDYNIYEYDAKSGKPLDHISRILRDGGMSYKIGGTATRAILYCIPSDRAVGVGLDPIFVQSIKNNYDTSKLYTSAKFIKGSKLQSRYEFIFTDHGFKTVSFSNPITNVQVYDESVVGYIDLVAMFDGDVGSGDMIEFIYLTTLHSDAIITVPETGGTRATSASLVVYPPENAVGEYEIYAKIVFEGIPYGEFDGYDQTIELDLDTGADVPVPMPGYIDCTIMPTEDHVNAVKNALFYDKVKNAKTINVNAMDIIPWIDPGSIFTHPLLENDYRIENVSISNSGTAITCCQLPWW